MNVEPPQRGLKTFVLLVIMGISTFLISRTVSGTVQSILLRAETTQKPEEIKVTNITESGVTISWLTKIDTSESILFGPTESLDFSQTTSTKSTTHHINLTDLSPNNTYHYKIGVGKTLYDNEGETYRFTTAPRTGNGISHKAYGQIIDAKGIPAEAAIVYLIVKDNDTLGSKGIAPPLSVLTNSNGIFTLDLGLSKTKDLSAPFYFSKSGDLVEIDIRGQYGEKASVLLDTNQLQPVPTIKLSVKGRLQDLTGQGPSSGEDIVLPKLKTPKPRETNPIKRLWSKILGRRTI